MEAATNIITAVRVRPLSEKDLSPGRSCAVSLSASSNSSLIVSSFGENREFKFDVVFGASNLDLGIKNDQSSIFEVLGVPVVNSCIKGMNNAVFAYGTLATSRNFMKFLLFDGLGQTGSGRAWAWNPYI
jgi:hypothetical protein